MERQVIISNKIILKPLNPAGKIAAKDKNKIVSKKEILIIN